MVPILHGELTRIARKSAARAKVSQTSVVRIQHKMKEQRK
jgi:hypothetical protein